MSGTAGKFQIEYSTQSNGASITELTLAYGSKEIRQIKMYQLLNQKADLLEMQTLAITPINVEKSRGLPFPVAIENKFESSQVGQISLVANINKIHGLPNLKGRLSLIIRQGDPFIPHKRDRDEQNDGPSDVSLPENSVLIDEQLEVQGEIQNARNKNQGHSEAARGSSSREPERKEPPRRQRKQNSSLRRKSLAGLATVIGVKKYETPPQKGEKAIMMVKSHVFEDYADLVAQAALY